MKKNESPWMTEYFMNVLVPKKWSADVRKVS